LRERAPETPVKVIPNAVCPAALLSESSGTNTLLFVGTMSYPPNADAVRFFCKQIFPLIRQRVPDVKLCVVGLEPPPEVRALEALGNIVVTGEVEDLTEYYRQAQVVIVPMRAGAGTRLKILEAMALGRPVVSTSVGCEGLAVRHGEHLMVADQPADFAGQVIELLANHEQRRRLCQRARRLVEQHHDWNVIGEQFLNLFRQLEPAVE